MLGEIKNVNYMWDFEFKMNIFKKILYYKI